MNSNAVYQTPISMDEYMAARWVAEGFFTHRVALPAGDAEAQEAWVTLGFGRYLTAAVRPTDAVVPLVTPRALTIERASPEVIEGPTLTILSAGVITAETLCNSSGASSMSRRVIRVRVIAIASGC